MIHALTIEISYDYGHHEGNAHVTQLLMVLTEESDLLRREKIQEFESPKGASQSNIGHISK